MDRLVIQKAVERKVFSKDAHWQLSARQFSFPIVVMCERIAVNSFVLSAMHTEIRLTVAVQIEFAQNNAVVDRLLEDSCGHTSPVPHHVSGKPGVQRCQLHLILVRVCRVETTSLIGSITVTRAIKISVTLQKCGCGKRKDRV